MGYVPTAFVVRGRGIWCHFLTGPAFFLGYDVTSCLVLCSFHGLSGPGEGYGPKEGWQYPPWMTDKHLWKHYLPATSVAGGKYWRQWKLSIFRKLRDMPGTNHIWQLNLTTKDSPQLIQKRKQKCFGVPLNVIVVFDFAHPCFIMIFKYLTDNLVALTFSQLLSHKWVGFHALLHLSRRVSVQVT